MLFCYKSTNITPIQHGNLINLQTVKKETNKHDMYFLRNCSFSTHKIKINIEVKFILIVSH